MSALIKYVKNYPGLCPRCLAASYKSVRLITKTAEHKRILFSFHKNLNSAKNNANFILKNTDMKFLRKTVPYDTRVERNISMLGALMVASILRNCQSS